MPTASDGSRERARRIADAFFARVAQATDDGAVIPQLAGMRLATALTDLEELVAAEIDLAERAAWVAASATKKATA